MYVRTYGQSDKRRVMDLRPYMILVGLLLSGIVHMGGPYPADAIPAMSRKTGEPCSTCHDVIPKLNHVGQQFRENGLRFPHLTERQTSREKRCMPPPTSSELGIDGMTKQSERCPEGYREHDAH